MLANNLNYNLKNWERSQKTKQNKTIQTRGIVVPSKIKKKENRMSWTQKAMRFIVVSWQESTAKKKKIF